jgi:phosphoribosylaminoimidazole-succinocarboxamide synthase
MRPALSDYQHLASGKVREIYRVDDDHLLLVATDRISAYDYVLDSTIPDKGRILTAMSVFFFDLVDAPNHLAGPPDDPRIPDEELGRALVVRQLEMLPVECVARGYLTGSGLLDYQTTGKVCGIALPPGLVEASRFATPLFTPATKAALGDHDDNISFARVIEMVGAVRANQLRDAADLCPGRRSRPDEGNHHRRHQVRIRQRPRRQPGAGRRDLHAGFLAVLAGRRVPGRGGPEEFRQAIRA